MKVEDLDQSKEWIDKFLEFCRKPVGFLLLAGENGTGKTTATEAIYNQSKIIQNPRYNLKYFFTQVDLHQRYLKDTKQWGDASYLLDELSATPLVVLDDIGTRRPTEALKDYMYAIIEKRERNKDKLGTILTTNLNSKQMREMFGDAIVSRVASGQVFRFEGPDRRFQDF